MSVSELITLHSDVAKRNVPALGHGACHPNVDVEVVYLRTDYFFLLTSKQRSGRTFNRDI